MPEIEAVQCVILAGGKSSRMGVNKALLPFDGEKSLIVYQYKKMSKIFKNVCISCKKEGVFDLDAVFLYEKSDIFSPLIGIENAFNTLGASKIFFVSVDTPFLKSVTIEKLCDVWSGYDIVYPKTKEKSHYLIGLWDQNVCKALSQAIQNKEYKVGRMISRLNSFGIEFQDNKEFSNLNTYGDYLKALEMIRKQNG
ncbi:molybdenum cofactor guanylyltransferase MobA [Helicobacter sp. 12S02232-10]|uniref:molybdenum cofactor guanylyltransferase MobA n=1 Tax=Helicobacter sp. 12S02232-10 TaxID=1476197 RepID=UPI0015DD8B4D|nr:molybdenum cofactor guanylyltransferase MobA [Helicobacter sp. 12S02232-10]